MNHNNVKQAKLQITQALYLAVTPYGHLNAPLGTRNHNPEGGASEYVQRALLDLLVSCPNTDTAHEKKGLTYFPLLSAQVTDFLTGGARAACWASSQVSIAII